MKTLVIADVLSLKKRLLPLGLFDEFPSSIWAYREQELSWWEYIFDFTIPIVELWIIIEICTVNMEIISINIYETWKH